MGIVWLTCRNGCCRLPVIAHDQPPAIRPATIREIYFVSLEPRG